MSAGVSQQFYIKTKTIIEFFHLNVHSKPDLLFFCFVILKTLNLILFET